MLTVVQSRRIIGNRFDRFGHFVIGGESCPATYPVNRLEAPCRYQPWHRLVGNAVARPLFDRGFECLLQGFFGCIEVAQQTNQGGEYASRFAAVNSFNRVAYRHGVWRCVWRLVFCAVQHIGL